MPRPSFIDADTGVEHPTHPAQHASFVFKRSKDGEWRRRYMFLVGSNLFFSKNKNGRAMQMIQQIISAQDHPTENRPLTLKVVVQTTGAPAWADNAAYESEAPSDIESTPTSMAKARGASSGIRPASRSPVLARAQRTAPPPAQWPELQVAAAEPDQDPDSLTSSSSSSIMGYLMGSSKSSTLASAPGPATGPNADALSNVPVEAAPSTPPRPPRDQSGSTSPNGSMAVVGGSNSEGTSCPALDSGPIPSSPLEHGESGDFFLVQIDNKTNYIKWLKIFNAMKAEATPLITRSPTQGKVGLPPGCVKQGYLKKRALAQNKSKVQAWKVIFVQLFKEKLVYHNKDSAMVTTFKLSRDTVMGSQEMGNINHTVVIPTFSVKSGPTELVLQAFSLEETKLWISALHAGVVAAGGADPWDRRWGEETFKFIEKHDKNAPNKKENPRDEVLEGAPTRRRASSSGGHRHVRVIEVFAVLVAFVAYTVWCWVQAEHARCHLSPQWELLQHNEIVALHRAIQACARAWPFRWQCRELTVTPQGQLLYVEVDPEGLFTESMWKHLAPILSPTTTNLSLPVVDTSVNGSEPLVSQLPGAGAQGVLWQSEVKASRTAQRFRLRLKEDRSLVLLAKRRLIPWRVEWTLQRKDLPTELRRLLEPAGAIAEPEQHNATETGDHPVKFTSSDVTAQDVVDIELDLLAASKLLRKHGRSLADIRTARGLYQSVEARVRHITQQALDSSRELVYLDQTRAKVSPDYVGPWNLKALRESKALRAFLCFDGARGYGHGYGALSAWHASIRLSVAEAFNAEMRVRTYSNTLPLQGTLDYPDFRAIWDELGPEALNQASKGKALHEKLTVSSCWAHTLPCPYPQKFQCEMAPLVVYMDAYLFRSSAKGIVSQALAGAGETFKDLSKQISDKLPEWDNSIGLAYQGAFFTAAPWPYRDLGRAERLFAKLVANSPNSRRNWYYLGVVQLRQRQWQQAAEAFGTALDRPCASITEIDFCGYMEKQASRGRTQALKEMGVKADPPEKQEEPQATPVPTPVPPPVPAPVPAPTPAPTPAPPPPKSDPVSSKPAYAVPATPAAPVAPAARKPTAQTTTAIAATVAEAEAAAAAAAAAESTTSGVAESASVDTSVSESDRTDLVPESDSVDLSVAETESPDESGAAAALPSGSESAVVDNGAVGAEPAVEP